MLHDWVLWSIIALALIGLVLLIVRIRRRRAAQHVLEKDPSGFWLYHPQTFFELKKAFGHKLTDSKDAKNADGSKKAEEPKAIAVITFTGDLHAHGHKALAAMVDEIEINKAELDEVVLVISSPGGFVSEYGHAYAQVERIRRTGLKLTVCIDVVAASGGYLVSLPANQIIAAPFATVGSVGVAAFIPNFREFLSRRDIVPRTFTAGRFKRTVTLTDEATPEEVARFQAQLESIHQLFLRAVKEYRPHARLDLIETGDHWTAQESVDLSLGLVDQLGTSSAYLLDKNRDSDLLLITHREKVFDRLMYRFFGAAAAALELHLRRYLTGL